MANIQGVVEVIMTNKFNADKVAMKLEGDDTWYGQSKEWMDAMPNRGDTVTFSGGKTGKYIQYLNILEKASGGNDQQQSTGNGGSPNPAAVGQVLNILLDSGMGLKDILKATDKKLAEQIKEAKDAKDRIASLWDGVKEEEPKPKAKPKKAELPELEEDDIPF